MPLYEYKCDRCGQVFEVIQRFSDEPLTAHEGCGGHVERLISAPSFQFKGSGFYITDYARGNGGAKPAPSAKNAGSGESKPASTSTESKPASSSSSDAKK
jgi:putative FmdB family regulatory protein